MDKSKEVYHRKDYSTNFGNDGFFIADCCNINKKSRSMLGSDGYYELPQGIDPYSDEAVSYLAGSNLFKVLEMEVFKFEWKK